MLVSRGIRIVTPRVFLDLLKSTPTGVALPADVGQGLETLPTDVGQGLQTPAI